ncbi:zinc finger protein (macronuclear) [Tetrahymena thermophila SB210]|uniref:Zinc finger protein n=1 Tax=Tetrahymena thermophila (strain SB210) TaxID=312017 RepID=Q24BY9_TETTS|nr:zinc finger protein [Tetrahymena thermophila SB210]EAS05313.2 zinc finger protein [Tetrahymena thermophila SB210]|eukprot:XP_001025558.2 zinc finger protein [Tetrahymena thermophila SB210]
MQPAYFNTIQGQINIMVQQTQNQPQYSGNSFIIATSVSVAILIILLVIVILCARRKRQLQKRRLQQQLSRNRQELQQNNPSSNIDQQLLQSLLNQNPMALLAQSVLMNLPQAVQKDDKKYFQDFDKCFPLMTLQQIQDYLKQENPNIKAEDINKECSICYCDFDEEKDEQEDQQQEKEKKQNQNQQQINSQEGQEKQQIKQQKKNLRILTYCNHFFHDQCIKDWLKKDKTCPHCRQKLSQQELNQIKNLLENKVIERTKRLIQNLQMHSQQKSEVQGNQITQNDQQNEQKSQNQPQQQINNEDKKELNQNNRKSSGHIQNKTDQSEQKLNKNVNGLQVDLNLNQKEKEMEINIPLKKLSNMNIVSNKSLSKKKKYSFQQLDSPIKKKSLSPLQKLKQKSSSQQGEDQVENFNLHNYQAVVLNKKDSQSPRKKNNTIGISPLIQSINNSNTSIVSERLQDSQMEQSIIIDEDVQKCQIYTQEDENSKNINPEDLQNINILEQIKEEEEEEKHQQELKGQFDVSFAIKDNPMHKDQYEIQNQYNQTDQFQFEQNTQLKISFSGITQEIKSQINSRLENLQPKNEKKSISKTLNQGLQKQPQSTLIEMKDLSVTNNKKDKQ